MSAAPNQFDFSAPPVIKTISTRSLIVGVVFGLGALALAFTRTDEFYRAYLLGFMCWLGVALGSMAILMIRHLTGGGWGMVIRRILGAAMRTLPVLAILFIPMIIGVLQHRIYPWLMPLDAIQDAHIREHLEKHSFIKAAYLNASGFIIRAVIYFLIWNVLSFLLSMWSTADGRARRSRQHPKIQSRRRTRPHPLRIHHLLRRDRLGHVSRSELDLDHLRPDHPHRRSALGHVLRGRRRAHSL